MQEPDKGARGFQPAINRGQECPRSSVRPFGGPTRRSAPAPCYVC